MGKKMEGLNFINSLEHIRIKVEIPYIILTTTMSCLPDTRCFIVPKFNSETLRRNLIKNSNN